MYQSRASRAAASARMAPIDAVRLSASAARRPSTRWLKASVRASSSRLERAGEVARGGHRGDRARRAIDRPGERPRQPQAADRRERYAAERDRRQCEERRLRRLARGGVNRIERVDPRHAGIEERADGVFLAEQRAPLALGALRKRGEQFGRKRARHGFAFHGDHHRCPGQLGQLPRVRRVEAGPDEQRADVSLVEPQRRARDTERPAGHGGHALTAPSRHRGNRDAQAVGPRPLRGAGRREDAVVGVEEGNHVRARQRRELFHLDPDRPP